MVALRLLFCGHQCAGVRVHAWHVPLTAPPSFFAFPYLQIYRDSSQLHLNFSRRSIERADKVLRTNMQSDFVVVGSFLPS